MHICIIEERKKVVHEIKEQLHCASIVARTRNKEDERTNVISIAFLFVCCLVVPQVKFVKNLNKKGLVFVNCLELMHYNGHSYA